MAGSERCYNPSVQMDPKVSEYLTVALGGARLQAIELSMCKPPLQCCLRVNKLRATAQEAIAALKTAAVAASDQQEGETRRHFPEAYVHDKIDRVICIPGKGPNSVDFSDPRLKEVVVTRKAGEAILRGAQVYAPGVLAASQGLVRGDRVMVSIALETPGKGRGFGMTRGWVLKPGTGPSDGPGCDRTRLHIGIGTALLSRRETFKALHGCAVQLQERVFDIPPCDGLMIGLGTLQNLPSTVAALVVQPEAGMRVLDMCAAPGGKTCALAELMQNRGTIIALDRTTDKVKNIKAMAGALGHSCIHAMKKDATRLLHLSADVRAARREQAEFCASRKNKRPRGDAAEMSEKEIARRRRRSEAAAAHGHPEPKHNAVPSHAVTGELIAEDAPDDQFPDGFERESFDRILLDGPCTALGLRPRLTVDVTLKELERAAHYQRMMMREGAHLLKVGATMVYSTCTLNPKENEANVQWFLQRYSKHMTLISQEPVLGGPGIAGAAQVPAADGGVRHEAWLSEEHARLVQRFDATTGLDTIAFFIARFQKVASIPEEDAIDEIDRVLPCG